MLKKICLLIGLTIFLVPNASYTKNEDIYNMLWFVCGLTWGAIVIELVKTKNIDRFCEELKKAEVSLSEKMDKLEKQIQSQQGCQN